ncbi:MAG TPA: polysaccharide biosynthesis/export family protein, partial [Burkholderiaceae bacterium]
MPNQTSITVLRRVGGLAAMVLSTVLLLACSTMKYPAAPQIAATPDQKYLIGPLDTLNIIVWRNPELSLTVAVRPDGRI